MQADLSPKSQVLCASTFIQPFRSCLQLLHPCRTLGRSGRRAAGPARAGSCRASAVPDSSGWDVMGPGPVEGDVTRPGRPGLIEGDVAAGDGGRGAQPLGLWGVRASPALFALA